MSEKEKDDLIAYLKKVDVARLHDTKRLEAGLRGLLDSIKGAIIQDIEQGDRVSIAYDKAEEVLDE